MNKENLHHFLTSPIKFCLYKYFSRTLHENQNFLQKHEISCQPTSKIFYSLLLHFTPFHANKNRHLHVKVLLFIRCMYIKIIKTIATKVYRRFKSNKMCPSQLIYPLLLGRKKTNLFTISLQISVFHIYTSIAAAFLLPQKKRK